MLLELIYFFRLQESICTCRFICYQISFKTTKVFEYNSRIKGLFLDKQSLKKGECFLSIFSNERLIEIVQNINVCET